jgi:acetyl-CoA C-acetyltransferase
MGKAQPGDTALSLQCEAARQAILDAGLKPADIDASSRTGTTARPGCW